VADRLTAGASLAEVAETSTRALLDLVGWTGEILHSSALPARPGRSERLADLTQAAGCNGYLYGTGGARFLDITPFLRLGLSTYVVAPPSLVGHTPSPPVSTHRISALWTLMKSGPSAVRDQLCC
jgi:WbqC-like protein family